MRYFSISAYIAFASVCVMGNQAAPVLPKLGVLRMLLSQVQLKTM